MEHSFALKTLSLNGLWLLAKAISTDVPHESGGTHTYAWTDPGQHNDTHYYNHYDSAGNQAQSSVTQNHYSGNAVWNHPETGQQATWQDVAKKPGTLGHSVLSHFRENAHDLQQGDSVPRHNVDHIKEYDINHDDTMKFASQHGGKEYKDFDDFIGQEQKLKNGIRGASGEWLQRNGMQEADVPHYLDSIPQYMYSQLQRAAHENKPNRLPYLYNNVINDIKTRYRNGVEAPMHSKGVSSFEQLKEAGTPEEKMSRIEPVPEERTEMSSPQQKYYGKLRSAVDQLKAKGDPEVWKKEIVPGNSRTTGEIMSELIEEMRGLVKDPGVPSSPKVAYTRLADRHYAEDVKKYGRELAPRETYRNKYHSKFRPGKSTMYRGIREAAQQMERSGERDLRLSMGMLTLFKACEALAFRGGGSLSKMWDDFQPEKWQAAVNMTRRTFGDEHIPGFDTVVANNYKKLTWDQGSPLPLDATNLVKFRPDIPVPTTNMFLERQASQLSSDKKINMPVDIQAL